MRDKVKYHTSALLEHPLFKAGIAAALHNIYYSNILNPNVDVSEISKSYSAAFADCPSFRQIIQETGEKYAQEREPITSLLIDSVPPRELVFQVTFNNEIEKLNQ